MNISILPLPVQRYDKVDKQEIKSKEVFSEVLKREERKLRQNEK